MKYATLTSALLVALASTSSFAATVYDNDGTTLKVGGRAEARFNVSDNNESAEDSSFKDKSRARVNLKGKTEISDGFYGFGKYEAEFSDSDSLKNRYFFAGFGTSAGEFSYGKQDSAQVQLTDITDVMATFGGDAADLVSGNKDKRDNNFLYAGEFDSLSIQANYIAADEKDADSYGISALYGFGVVSLGAGYVSQDAGTDSDDQINLAAEYSQNGFTLGALYTIGSKSNEDYTGYELAAQYKATKKLKLVAVYNFAEFDKADTEEANNFAAEAVYKFNGNFRAYAGYKFESLDGKDDQLQAGMRYDF
ncbi:porin [Grimontia marina]|uniref:Porin-like protein L n=1 Tax=Grimontia marina TaxID=646534 RepID=A0A128FAR9_9GAMM|nr:porin [Grimontia marina]CZF83897.1 Porin-like protein L precursor [Grimontia marina]